MTAPGDVREEPHCRELVERTVPELGGIDVLVSTRPDVDRGHRGPEHRAADLALLGYASTKGGLVNVPKGLAQELGLEGIRVDTVAPRPIPTPLIPATMPPEQVESFGAETPIGRAGRPAELARAYVFLASQEFSDITGERTGVTGGMPMP